MCGRQHTVREGIGGRRRISDGRLAHVKPHCAVPVAGATSTYWIHRSPGRYESAARLRDPFNHYELALAAPREEIGREIRRVAVSFPLVGFLLWRVGIRLHHFPVQMP